MITPPDPHLPSAILAIAAKFGFLVKQRDPMFGELGVLADGAKEHPLYVGSAGGDRVTWTLEAGPRMDPHLMSRATYDVLAGGKMREDNTVAYQGKVFGLGWRWSASGMVAEATAIESAAA